MQPSCTKCGGDTLGYKCAVCGQEYEVKDTAHVHGAETVMPKCVGCGEADVNCSCESL